MDDHEYRLCLEALWDNAVDGRFADLKYDSDFDRAEADLDKAFREFLAAR